MTDFLITEEEIETIKKLLRERNNYKQIKEILDNLENEEIKEKLKRLIRDSGKTNIIQIDKLKEILK